MLSKRELQELGYYMSHHFLGEDFYEKAVHKKPIFHWERVPNKSQKDVSLNRDGKVDYYWNPETCEKSINLCDVTDNNPSDFRIMEIGARGKNGYGTERHGYYMEYVEEFDVIVLGHAIIEGKAVTKNNQNQPRMWIPKGEIFIDREKNIYSRIRLSYNYDYGHWVSTYSDIVLIEDYYKLPFRLTDITLIEQKCLDTGINGGMFKDFSYVLLKMFPNAICNIGANNTVDITGSIDNFGRFLKYNEPSKRHGPKQEKIDELTSISLPTVSYSDSLPDRAAFIHKVKDGMCVLRTMYKDKYTHTMKDCARIYVSMKECLSCRPNNNNEWINMMLNSDAKNWDFMLVEIDGNATKGTKLEYFSEIMNEIPMEFRGRLIWLFLTSPIFEQIAKAGGKEFVLGFIEEMNSGRPMNALKQIFGTVNVSAKKLNDKLGINKYQLKKILEIANNNMSIMPSCLFGRSWSKGRFVPLPALKTALSNEDIVRRYAYNFSDIEYSISDIDNATFDMLLNEMYLAYKCSESDGDFIMFANILGQINRMYGMPTMLKMSPKVRGIIGKTVPYENNVYNRLSGLNVLRLYYDFIDIADQMMDADESLRIRCDFDPENLEGIRQMHDEIWASRQLCKNKIDSEKFNRSISKLPKWEFDGDEKDEFRIVAPKAPIDLVNEGAVLHHCVGGYVRRVANGETNIMFLRKKEEPDDSFYTIEITNDGSVQQVHGVCNRNMAVDSPEYKFIRKWIGAKHLKKTNWNKVR